jgi:hypothetical protein
MSLLGRNLKSKFGGNIGWYGETIKLDMEARGYIERCGTNPQRYRLK